MKKNSLIFFFVLFNLSLFSQPINKDRWIVMDFAWFRPETAQSQADSLFERYLPVWQNTSGEKGIIFNINWVVDFITEYNGDINQKLPFHTPNSAWWNSKTYKDIKDLIGLMRSKAAAAGLTNFHVGMECIAFRDLVMEQGKYNYPSDWAARHPELFKNYGVIDPTCKLEKDKYVYAARPKGIRQGEYFSAFFGEQWGFVSKAMGMDVLLLWDSWATLKAYNRCGAFGDRASGDPSKNKAISDAVIRTFRDIKKGNPDALLIGYSSGASAIGELRVNTFDLEALVADGSIDIWIDQTWGGAWNDFWGMERDGWTFQLAYQLQHATMIAAGNLKRTKPCKHYNIVAPLDAYEPWDIIHSTPNKLRWSIWAQNNACVITPNGYKHIDGSVLAWANSPFMKLLSKADVAVIADALNAADRCAAEMKTIYGATFVYNKSVTDWLNAKDPASLNAEWIDEQTAMMMKWGMPCMSATRAEWMPAQDTIRKNWIYQLPGQLAPSVVDQIEQISKTGSPQLFIGRVDRMDRRLLDLAGISFKDTLYSRADYECIMEANAEPGLAKQTNVYLSEFKPVLPAEGTTYVRTPQTALVTQSSKTPTFYWMPPDWRHPSQASLDLQQFGSIVPYYTVVREMQRASRRSGLTHMRPSPVMTPVTFHFWESGKRIYFLFGNLESGSIGDSRTKREAFLYLNTKELMLEKGKPYELKEYYAGKNMMPFGSDVDYLIYYVKIDSDGIGLYYIER